MKTYVCRCDWCSAFRRGAHVFWLLALIAPLLAGSANAAGPDPEGFTSEHVAALARQLAGKPYRPTRADGLVFPSIASGSLPDGRKTSLPELDWRSGSNGFVITPLPYGQGQSVEADLYVISKGRPRHVAHDPASYPDGPDQNGKPSRRFGFVGFRIQHLAGDSARRSGIEFHASGQYAAYGWGQRRGASALPFRAGQTVRSGDGMPITRTYWIERTSAGSNRIVVHALHDSQTATGACQYTLNAGEAVIADVECLLFARRDAPGIVIAPVQGAHFSGDLGRRRHQEVRRAAHEVSGLEMLTGAGERIWRPVANRDRHAISAFIDADPKGFGLMQRQQNFAYFLDDNVAWESSPSVWTEPHDGWGKGIVMLDEVPANSHYNKNIIAYWKPQVGLKAQSSVEFSYRQTWGSTDDEAAHVARVRLSRSGRLANRANGQEAVGFLIEFEGDELKRAPSCAALTASIEASKGMISKAGVKNSTDRSRCRVTFQLDPGANPQSELRLALFHNGRQLTETWLFRWTP